MLDRLKIAYSGGTHEVKRGDRFKEPMSGAEWEVRDFRLKTTYGPSGLGGTPIIGCLLVSGKPTHCCESDGLVDFCGDSVAAFVVASASDASEKHA